jgi:hypothetical protein
VMIVLLGKFRWSPSQMISGILFLFLALLN